MIADIFTWLNGQAWFTAVGTGLGYVTLAGLVGIVWRLWHSRCKIPWCLRPGEMPVEGTAWRTCCVHAQRPEHERLRAEHERRPDRDDCVTY